MNEISCNFQNYTDRQECNQLLMEFTVTSNCSCCELLISFHESLCHGICFHVVFHSLVVIDCQNLLSFVFPCILMGTMNMWDAFCIFSSLLPLPEVKSGQIWRRLERRSHLRFPLEEETLSSGSQGSFINGGLPGMMGVL